MVAYSRTATVTASRFRRGARGWRFAVPGKRPSHRAQTAQRGEGFTRDLVAVALGQLLVKAIGREHAAEEGQRLGAVFGALRHDLVILHLHLAGKAGAEDAADGAAVDRDQRGLATLPHLGPRHLDGLGFAAGLH